jgi:hypothetical protein
MVLLRQLNVPLRLSVACFVLILAGGYAAALAYMVHHYSGKDERAGLSMEDLAGSYHGVSQESPLRRSLQGEHGRSYAGEEERGFLLQWLANDRDQISEDYDHLDLGDQAPAEILDRNCVSCHARNPTDAAAAQGIGERVPLEFWDDIAKVAYSRKLHPVPTHILLVSTHTHALTLALLTLASSLLVWCTSWPGRLRDALILLAWIALVLDLGSWWLARFDPRWVYAIVVGGALYGIAYALHLLAITVELLRSKVE